MKQPKNISEIVIRAHYVRGHKKQFKKQPLLAKYVLQAFIQSEKTNVEQVQP